MSQRLNQQLKILEQQTKNELFIREQRQKEKPSSVKLAEKVQLPKKDEQLLVQEKEDAMEDFDPTLIALDPIEVPIDVNAIVTNKTTLVDTELAKVINDITDISNEPDQLKRRGMMDALILAGNMITPTLEAELPATIEYDDMQGIIDADLQKRVDDFNAGAPERGNFPINSAGTKQFNKAVKAFNATLLTFRVNEEMKINDDYVPIMSVGHEI